jgi:hypothetical protein
MRPIFQILLLAVLAPVSAFSQQAATPTKEATEAAKPAEAATVPEMTMKEVKQKLGMVVFPAKSQTPEVQEAEELACLQWSADQLGIKPNTPAPDPKAAGQAAAEKTDEATKGVAVKTAAKGAAAGAIIGSISGNAGAGAAYGAAGGALVGRRAKKGATAQADAEAQKKVEAEQKAKMDGLKKAMTACLESKGYTVK